MTQTKWPPEKPGRFIFADSAVTGPAERSLLEDIYRKLLFKANTPKQAHVLRQQVFNMLDLGKQQGQLTDFAEVIANRTRAAIKDDIVDQTGTFGRPYAAESQVYAEVEEALSEFFRLIGKKWTGKNDALLGLRAGEVGSRVLGNASADPLRVIDLLESVARKHGLKAADNPLDQLIFNDILEDLLGSTQTRSLRGQVARGARDAASNIAGLAEDVVTGNKLGALKKGFDYLRGITPEEQMRALMRLLD